MKQIRILLIGPMPPPSGGVSIHLSRLLAMTQGESDIQMSIFDLRRFRLHNIAGSTHSIFQIVSAFMRAGIVHVHMSHSLKLWILIMARSFGKKTFYTHHNSRNLNDELTLRTMHVAQHVVLVRNLVQKLPLKFSKKIRIIPAYIPSGEIKVLPQHLVQQFEKRRVLISHCYQRMPDPLLVDGKDLYGFDLILDAMEIIFKQEPNENLLLVLADPADAMEKVHASRIEELNRIGNSRILYLKYDLELSAVLPYCEVLIRATRSDGDAISVREALHTGVKVLASNCTERPEGVSLFKSGDAVSLTEELVTLLERKQKNIHPQKDYGLEILEFYRQCVSRTGN